MEAAALSAQLKELLTAKEYTVLAMRFRLLDAPHPPKLSGRAPIGDERLASDLMTSGAAFLGAEGRGTQQEEEKERAFSLQTAAPFSPRNATQRALCS